MLSAYKINQDYLVQQLEFIFPNHKPIVNSRSESNIKYTSSENYFLELDVWFPSCNICFEFQDEYHYKTTWYSHSYLSHIQARDCNKKEQVHRNNITLIVVPFWWNGDVGSLASTIHFYRPDLIPENVEVPIALAPSTKNFSVFHVPGVGELMYAAFDTHVQHTNSNWWLGEKYDGVRFCWNPSDRVAYSRYGNTFSLLPNFTLNFVPKIVVDGEFWFGRGSFSLIYPLIKATESVLWDHLRMVIFDAPSFEMQSRPFEQRYYHLLDNISTYHQFLIVASRLLTQSHLFAYFLHLSTNNGGEGIIVRKYGSLYEHGRSLDLLKFKDSLGDREAMVLGTTHDHITLLFPDGASWRTTKKEGDANVNRLNRGDVVTVTNMIELKLRPDVQWSNVVSLYNQDRINHGLESAIGPLNIMNSSILDTTNSTSNNTIRPNSKRLNNNIHSLESMRSSITPPARRWSIKSGKAILKKLGGYKKTIKTLFPELMIKDAQFESMPKWGDIKNRKLFFETFAKENGFDPLNPDNWYQNSIKRLFPKNIRGIEKYHKNRVSQALLDLFPEIGLDGGKLASSWSDPKNRRKFFEDYAKSKGFDPLISQNWFSESVKSIKSQKRVRSVLSHHGHSFSKALSELFPEMGLKSKSQKTWEDPVNRRKFFEDYATKEGFDPLIPENWYKQSRMSIKLVPGSRSILHYHGSSILRSLQDLFPEIGLQASMWNRHHQ